MFLSFPFQCLLYIPKLSANPLACPLSCLWPRNLSCSTRSFANLVAVLSYSWPLKLFPLSPPGGKGPFCSDSHRICLLADDCRAVDDRRNGDLESCDNRALDGARRGRVIVRKKFWSGWWYYIRFMRGENRKREREREREMLRFGLEMLYLESLLPEFCRLTGRELSFPPTLEVHAIWR